MEWEVLRGHLKDQGGSRGGLEGLEGDWEVWGATGRSGWTTGGNWEV